MRRAARLFSTRRARPAVAGAPMVWACWSNRPPSHFWSGGACTRRPSRFTAACGRNSMPRKRRGWLARLRRFLGERRKRRSRPGTLARLRKIITERYGRLSWQLRWVVGAIGALFAVLLALQLWYLVHILWWNWFDPSSTQFMRQQLQVLRERDPAARITQRWVPYERISPNLKRAVLASEDARFSEHEGVDWDAIERAWEQNRKRGKVVR